MLVFHENRVILAVVILSQYTSVTDRRQHAELCNAIATFASKSDKQQIVRESTHAVSPMVPGDDFRKCGNGWFKSRDKNGGGMETLKVAMTMVI